MMIKRSIVYQTMLSSVYIFFYFLLVNRLMKDDILTATSLLLLCSCSLASNKIDISRQFHKQALQLSEAIGNDRMELKCFFAVI